MHGSQEDGRVPLGYSLQCLLTVEINTEHIGFTCKEGDRGDRC